MTKPVTRSNEISTKIHDSRYGGDSGPQFLATQFVSISITISIVPRRQMKSKSSFPTTCGPGMYHIILSSQTMQWCHCCYTDTTLDTWTVMDVGCIFIHCTMAQCPRQAMTFLTLSWFLRQIVAKQAHAFVQRASDRWCLSIASTITLGVSDFANATLTSSLPAMALKTPTILLHMS